MEGQWERMKAAGPGADPRNLLDMIKSCYMVRQAKMRQLSLTPRGQQLMFELLLEQVRGLAGAAGAEGSAGAARVALMALLVLLAQLLHNGAAQRVSPALAQATSTHATPYHA
jgi:F0F1-type ATP synthase membrane subunit a